MERVGTREQASDRAVCQQIIVFVSDWPTGFTRGVIARAVVSRLEQNDRRAVSQRGLFRQLRQRFTQCRQIGLLEKSPGDIEQPLLTEIAHRCIRHVTCP